ncbi:MAG: FIST N-terminal domain-containing protein [Granulosicoccus sp.]
MDSSASGQISKKTYSSGTVVLWSESANTLELCERLTTSAADGSVSLAIIWFSATRHRASDITSLLAGMAPELEFCGCSTSGEVTPGGMQDHGFIAILLPRRWFSAQTLFMDNVSTLGMESIAKLTSDARTSFLASLEDEPDKSSLFAVNLIDGLSKSEETVTVAIDRGLDGIPLIGGSAGDDFNFQNTWQICNGRLSKCASILTLFHCKLPCRVYSNNNFVPTEHKLVVTEADPDQRRVIEFNGEPAVIAYANAIGMDPEELDAASFATYSVVVRFGGQNYCRSIQQINDDQSMTFFCAIDNGLVLTVARSKGMIASSRQAIEEVEANMGSIDFMFGFDCIYRKLDAQHRQSTHRIAALYQEKKFVGFNAYGEQINSIHVNQTFTGIAIGTPSHNT